MKYATHMVKHKNIYLSLEPTGIKVTQINFVSRNQLHNTGNSCQHLNFGLSWSG